MFGFVVADGRRRGTKVAENEGDLSPSTVTHSGPCGSRKGGPRLTDQLEEMRWELSGGPIQRKADRVLLFGDWNGNVRGLAWTKCKGKMKLKRPRGKKQRSQ